VQCATHGEVEAMVQAEGNELCGGAMEGGVWTVSFPWMRG